MGGFGDGAFRVVNGATAGAYTLEVGYGNQGEGEVVVSGIGSRLDTENLDVALNKGRGVLKVENGGEVHAFWSYIGQGEESVGEAQIIGPSRLYTSELHVGASGGKGTLSLENMTGAGTAYASSSSLTVGQGAGSEGSVVVGMRSRMDLDGPLEIGTEGGSGRLTLDQGTAQAKSTVIIGKEGGTGILNIQSQGRFAVSKDVVIGQNGGSGTIDLRSGGEMLLLPPIDGTLRFLLAEGEYSHGVMNIGTGGSAGTFEQYASNYEIHGGTGTAILNFNHTEENFEIWGKITGSTIVNHTGSGQTTIRANNSYTGGTFITSGTVVVKASSVMATPLGDGIVSIKNGALILDSSILNFRNEVYLGIGSKFVNARDAGVDISNIKLASTDEEGAFSTLAQTMAGTLSKESMIVSSFASISSAFNDDTRISDVLDFEGTDDDVIVLQLGLSSTLADEAFLAWLDPETNLWINAVEGNVEGTNTATGLQRGYLGSFATFQARVRHEPWLVHRSLWPRRKLGMGRNQSQQPICDRARARHPWAGPGGNCSYARSPPGPLRRHA